MQHQQLGSRPMQGSLAGQQRMQPACPPLPAFLLRRGMALSVLRPSTAYAVAGHGHATAVGTAAAAGSPLPLSVSGSKPSRVPLKLGRTALALPTPACGRQWGGGTNVPTRGMVPAGMHAPLVPQCYIGSTTRSAPGELETQVRAHNSCRGHTQQFTHAICYPQAGVQLVSEVHLYLSSPTLLHTPYPHPGIAHHTPNPRIYTWAPLLPAADASM